MEERTTPPAEGRSSWWRRRPRWQKLGLIAAVLLVGLASLSSRNPELTPARSMGGGWGRLDADASKARVTMRIAERAATIAPARPRSILPSPVGAPLPATSLETWGRQLILTGTVGLEVQEVRTAYQRVQLLAAAEGALVTGAMLEAVPGKEGRSYGYATLVLRAPQARFHALRARLLELGGEPGARVLRDEVSTQDVTEEYVDLRARLRHWQAQERQLLQIMRQAHRVPDILAVQNQLSAVQQEIERVAGRLRFLENRVDLSTLTVELRQRGHAPGPPTLATLWPGAGSKIRAAWSKSLVDALGLLASLAATLTYLLPFAVLAALVWLPARRALRRLGGRP